MLNGRVRNGNGCDHSGMFTGKFGGTELRLCRVSVSGDELREFLWHGAKEEEQCGQAFGC